jgi:hypothetical protein
MMGVQRKGLVVEIPSFPSLRAFWQSFNRYLLKPHERGYVGAIVISGTPFA